MNIIRKMRYDEAHQQTADTGEVDVVFTEGGSESQFIGASQLDSWIHIYDTEDIRDFALREWWGLPPRFRGLLLPVVISLVVHAISLAFTLKVAAVLCPLVEFLQVVGQVLALQNSFPSTAPYFCWPGEWWRHWRPSSISEHRGLRCPTRFRDAGCTAATSYEWQTMQRQYKWQNKKLAHIWDAPIGWQTASYCHYCRRKEWAVFSTQATSKKFATH